MGLVLARTSIPEGSRSFLDVGLLLVMTYIGLVIGARKGDMLNLQALGGLFGSERSTRRQPKVFDTSVIIDGRVADICEVHFLEGVLLLPQFVLRELQLVADSADSLKRQRGRRGLEVLQRIQKMTHLEVEITEDDFPQIAEVDLKLVELAKRYDAKIVTNDYNLNKVASLQGIAGSAQCESARERIEARGAALANRCASLFSAKARSTTREWPTLTMARWWLSMAGGGPSTKRWISSSPRSIRPRPEK